VRVCSAGGGRRVVLPNGGDLAHVTLAGEGARVTERHEAAHEAAPASAVAFSAATWRSTSAKVADSCAPETPYFRSIT